jgi:hypothetical protein
MVDRELLVRWSLANAVGMALGFLAFLQTLMFLGFGFEFGNALFRAISAASAAPPEEVLVQT